jgi:hypothetical protein
MKVRSPYGAARSYDLSLKIRNCLRVFCELDRLCVVVGIILVVNWFAGWMGKVCGGHRTRRQSLRMFKRGNLRSNISTTQAEYPENTEEFPGS